MTKHFRIISKIKLNLKDKNIQNVGTDLLIVRPDTTYLDLNMMTYFEKNNCLEKYLTELTSPTT